MKILIALTALLLLSTPARSADVTYGDAAAMIVSVYDGDTLKVNIYNWAPLIGARISVRVYGIDCKEIGEGGEAARDFVRSLIPPGSFVWLRNLRRDKYFRLLADVGFDCGSFEQTSTCDSLAAILIEKGLAVPYFGGTR